jgi:hypothetical protein
MLGCIVMSLCHPLVQAHEFYHPLGPRYSRYTAALGAGKTKGPSLGGSIMYHSLSFHKLLAVDSTNFFGPRCVIQETTFANEQKLYFYIEILRQVSLISSYLFYFELFSKVNTRMINTKHPNDIVLHF